MMKNLVFVFYCAVVVCMAIATIVEKYLGSDIAGFRIYGAWWFVALWALLAASAICYFVSRRVRRPSVVTLHLSFVVILMGALFTHLFAKHGFIHIRMNDTTDTYYIMNGGDDMTAAYLPFSIELTSFEVKYHAGTEAVADYESKFLVHSDAGVSKGIVSMNRIFSYNSYRIYQSSFDEDLRGSVLSVNHDPIGIPVTYMGYALLFVSLVWILFDPRGYYRNILRSSVFRKGISVAALCLFPVGDAYAATVLPKETAREFGKLNILYNNRICPLQTFAIDFTKKLCGSTSYKEYTPEQVFTGFVLFGDEWYDEPIIKIKSRALQKDFALPAYTSINSFFDGTMNNYILGSAIQKYYDGDLSPICKQAVDIDNRIQLVMEVKRGSLLKIFPITTYGKTVWYAPTDEFPAATDTLQVRFMQNVLSFVCQESYNHEYSTVNEVISKIRKYQSQNGGSSLPSARRQYAERIYNAVPFASMLFKLNLTMGFLGLFCLIAAASSRKVAKYSAAFTVMSVGVMCLSFLALTACLVLRLIIKGSAPMSNGYETMLVLAWFAMIASLVVSRRFRAVLTFGFLLSGLFLLVSHINLMDPQISHIVPVLSSPLLSLHVSIIMMSFALLSFTFACGLAAIIMLLVARQSPNVEERIGYLHMLSQLFLYPAMTALGIGIFLGAVWANISWGTYWGWDPKEVWALITFMVYAVALHPRSIAALQRPTVYHIFMVAAFLTILMTYFGVNYFLGGMHSYA